jgi:hypothetical protein
MATFIVTDKATGNVVTTYNHDVAIELGPYTFDLYSHTTSETAEDAFVEPVFKGKRHLTKLEFRKLLRPNEEVAMDKIRAKFESMAFTEAQKDAIRVINNKYQEATYIDLDDAANAQGLGFFAQLGALDNFERVQEILNG